MGRMIYDRPTWQLLHDFADKRLVQDGDTLLRVEIKEWFRINYPRISPKTIDRNLMRMSTNERGRLHFRLHPERDNLFYRNDVSTFRRYIPGRDPAPILK